MTLWPLDPRPCAECGGLGYKPGRIGAPDPCPACRDHPGQRGPGVIRTFYEGTYDGADRKVAVKTGWRWETADYEHLHPMSGGPFPDEPSAVLAARCALAGGVDLTHCVAGREVYWLATLHVDEGKVKRRVLPGRHPDANAALCAALDAKARAGERGE